MKQIVCVPKSLTPAQAQIVARRSLEVNPANAAAMETVERTPAGRRGGPRRLALLVGHRWPETGQRFSVQFLDAPATALRKRLLAHMNAWSRTANVSFVETKGAGMVRVARFDSPPDMAGYWSYVGTEILGIEEDQPTMNLEGFTIQTPESEFRRVVRHEAGHTLGFDHEHMRAELIKKIDRKKAFVYFDRTQGWTREETLAQVLTPLRVKSIMGTTEADPISIMCYEVPAEITKDGKAIPGGLDINPVDYAFAAKIYPKAQPGAGHATRGEGVGEETDDADRKGVATPPTSQGRSVPEADEFHLVIMDDFRPEGEAAPSPETESGNAKKGPKFARVYASYCGARVTHAMRLRADRGEPPTAYGQIIRFHERIKKYTNNEEGTLPTDEQMIQFGGYLFETLFQGDVRRLYDEARARQASGKLNFVFTSMIPWIAEKPWEFAYDPGRRSFLATEEVHLLRNVLTSVPADVVPTRRGPLRILVVSAQPVGLGRLSIQQEEAVIRRGFEALREAGLVELEVIARATPNRLLGHVSTGDFDIVHFIGHGKFDEEKQEGALIFEDERGGEIVLGERETREILCKRGLSLVFLNSCQSGSGGRADFNKGIAQALVAHGLPALVANQYSVLDSSATSFAQHFYWALAQGMSVGQATCEARIAVNCSMQGELIDWAVPVAYARDPDLVLCEKPARSTPSPATMVRESSRQATRWRLIRVAFWDMDNLFPALQRTLEQLNEAQQVFGFEVVSLSVPIDAWDVENRADDGSPYLWAEKLAHRLEAMPAELRVNVLACVTRYWLRDDDWLNLYGWWPTGRKPPVVLFSCAGLKDLPPEGPETERAIANATVTLLAGHLGDLGTHQDGSAKCPLAFNEKRDLAHITGAQKFDRACLQKLRANLPKELPADATIAALEAILEHFTKTIAP